MVTAEQAVEATEEMNKDTLSEKQSLHGDLQKLQVIELKKRIKTLEAKNSELTEMTQNFLEVENEVKEQLQKRQEGYERQKEELKDMQQQIKDDIHQQREKEESNNEERKIREEEIVHLRSEVDVLKSSLIDSFDDREEAEQVIYKLNMYTTLLEDRIMKLDDYVNEIESQKQKETVEEKLNERASDKKIVKILEDSKEAVHGDEGSVHRSLPVEFLQLEEECGRTATVNQERSVRPRFLIDNRNTDGDEGESDGSVNSYEETILAANMVEDEDGYKDEAEEEERKRYLLSRALGIEHRISVAAHLDAVNEQIIERRAFKGGVEPKTERGSYSLHSNGRAHSPNAIRSPQRRASPERIENIKYTADVHIEGINNSIGHDINGTRLNNGNSSSCIIPDTNEGQIGPHNNSNYVDRSVRRSDDKAVERVGMCSLNSASHLSVESKGSRIEGSLTNSFGNIEHGDYFIVSNPSIFDEKSMGKVALKAQNTGTFPSGEANIASLLRMQYGHLLNPPLSVIPSKNITGEMGAENWSKNSGDRGGRSEKYSGQRESDIIKRQLQDHYKSFENLSSELRTENPRSNISYPVLTNNSNTGLIRNIFGTTSTIGNLSLTSVLTGPTHPPSLSDSGSAGGLASSTSSSSSSSIVCPFERLKFQLRSQLECISSMGQRESHYSQSNGQQQQQQEQHLEQDNMQNCDRSILSHKIGTGETDTVAAVTTVNRDVKSVREELIACLLSSR